MTEVLGEAAVPIEDRGEPGIGAGETRGNGKAGMRTADALIDVLLVEDAVTAAHHRALRNVVSESDPGREVVVVRVEQLCPALAAGAVAAEYVSTRQSAGARVRDRWIHVREPAERVRRGHLNFIAEAQIQGELRRHFERVVNEPAVVF